MENRRWKMKKHFSKYLPVKGEIIEGDTFLEHVISYRLLHKRDSEWVICTLNLEKQFATVCKNPVKSKLFLCSRDIQVGDKFTQQEIDMIYPEARMTCINHAKDGDPICDEGKCYAINTVYKVIGEILTSNIKEGQEFTEKEIEFLTIGENIS